MNLNQWAIKWGIPPEAVEDLHSQFGIVATDPNRIEGQSEAAVQANVTLEASAGGGRLWRNNVGALFDERGIPVRYGLCNTSKQMNKIIKSSDLIGIMPVLITPSMVGSTIGQFTARECKAAGWTYHGTEREVAQLTFLELVARLGGNAAFVNNTGSLLTGSQLPVNINSNLKR